MSSDHFPLEYQGKHTILGKILYDYGIDSSLLQQHRQADIGTNILLLRSINKISATRKLLNAVHLGAPIHLWIVDYNFNSFIDDDRCISGSNDILRKHCNICIKLQD